MLRATYSKNPTVEDMGVLLHELKNLSEAEYLDFEVKYVKTEGPEMNSVFIYQLTDGVETYVLFFDLSRRLPKDQITEYNKIINFRDRILAWKEYVDKVYDHIVNSGINNRILPHVCFKDGAYIFEHQPLPEIDDKAALTVLTSIGPVNSLLDYFKKIRRTDDPIWQHHFSIQSSGKEIDRTWYEWANTWGMGNVIGQMSYWDRETKNWIKGRPKLIE